MDTLSRKHRLRQQLQKAKEQQTYQQQQQQLQVEYQVVSSGRKHQVGSAKQVEEDEEFRVFKVVEVVRGGGGERPPAPQPKLQQAASNKRKINNGARVAANNRLSWVKSASNGHHFGGEDDDDDDEEDEEDEEEDGDDEDDDEDDDVGGGNSGDELAIQLSPASCRLSQARSSKRPAKEPKSLNYSQHQHRCSTDSAKSIGDAGSSSSSGFLSSEGGGSRPLSIRSAAGGRLLDELDRLMNAGKMSPSDDSYLSLAATPVADSTLVRHRELDYSQVCRDEFSSFIEQPRAGPVLVGVHAEDEEQNSPSLRSSGELRISELLDSHLSRVDCLLRLSRGDGTVSMEEAFNSLDDILEEVSPELRTPVEFGPLQQRQDRLPEMRQRTETIELADAELDRLDEGELERRCSVQVASGWREVLAAATFQPPAHLELNWAHSSSCSSPTLRGAIDEALSERLERSLIEKLRPASRGEEWKLVKTIVRRHMSDFLVGYLEFQSELRANIEFARDWHQNWLFAWRRPAEEGRDEPAKRAKFDCTSDLLSYSTLILSDPKFRRTKLSSPPNSGPHSAHQLEALYEAQPGTLKELEAVERESRGQINLCNLLSLDDTCDKEKNSVRVIGGKARGHLLVKYATSNVPISRAHQFTAYGYLFESRLSRSRPRKSSLLERQILDRVQDLTLNPSSVRPAHPGDRVRFTVGLTNVELVNQLPVIQFCAKIAGRLPVRVRWFRLIDQQAVELSDPSRLPAHARRASLRQSSSLPGSAEGRKWPLDMQATSELSYQNEWSSWFRFRRFHDELLFEIREANVEQDYGQVYRCLVENCWSQSECTFGLDYSAKAGGEDEAADENNNNNKRPKKAILRTWSQRTLRQRAPETVGAPAAASESEEAARWSWQQTIDRRSSVLAAEAEDKFGRHFPYHPANLLKRLEENKFSSALKCRPLASGRPELELRDFAEPSRAEQATKVHSEVEPQHWRQSIEEEAEEEEEEAAKAVQEAPKPRLRLNRPRSPSRLTGHQREQVKRAPEVEPCRPKLAPRPTLSPAEAGASVKSLISRFSAA